MQNFMNQISSSSSRFAMTAAMLITMQLSSLQAQQPDSQDASVPATDRQKLILISPETTRITQPLTADGYVDYVAAMDALKARGATPATNFEVVVRQVMGHGELPEAIRPEYYDRLGIPVPAEDSFSYQTFQTFSNVASMSADQQFEFDQMYNAVSDSKWTAADYPQAAAWLKAVNPALDRLVDGAARPHYYTPYVTMPPADDEPSSSPPLMSLLLPAVQTQREIARALRIRAMSHLGEGNLDAAWKDLRAIRRIARHNDRNSILIEGLVAIAIDAITFTADQMLLNADLSAEQIQDYLRELNQLPDMQPMAAKIDQSERFMGLDATQSMARNIAAAGEIPGLDDGLLSKVLSMLLAGSNQNDGVSGVDWNVTLRLLNRHYDELVESMQLADPQERDAAFARQQQQLSELQAQMQNPLKMMFSLIGNNRRQKAGEAIGNVLVSLLLPAVQQVRTAEDLSRSRRDTVRIAFALRHHKQVTGSFPETLSELVPDYIVSLPVDPATGQPYTYRQQNNGFLIYGCGRNGSDDNGLTEDIRPENDRESDDIAVHYHGR